MKTEGRRQLVKVIRKQGVNVGVLALHPQFRVRTKCKECHK